MLTPRMQRQLKNEVSLSEVFWQSDGGEFHRITSVYVKPVDIEKDGMPVPVSFLDVGGYIDLENVDPESLHIMKPLFY